MKVHILTLFPGMFDSFVSHSILKRAAEKKIVSINAHDLRRYTHDRHRTCDDKPFGGGPGMLMKPDPIFEAYDDLFGSKKKLIKRRSGLAKQAGRKKDFRFVYLSPQGKVFNQKMAQLFSGCKEIAFLCGHYEGVDERVIEELVTDEVSIGDYILTGGELAAMVIIDAMVRLIPGVLGREESKEFESFTQNLLEYPQYTRPAVYRGLKVPQVLLSGNHQKIEEWRRKEAYQRTLKRRPDILKRGK